MRRSVTVLTVLVAFAATMIAPLAAQAGSKGRRNTALVGTAASIYLLAKGKTTQGLIAGAGTAYAWKRYNDSRKAENSRRYYRSGYRRGYSSGNRYGYKNGYSKGKHYGYTKGKRYAYGKRYASARYH